ncbi:crossover junction endodeoxyribonuclease RuvC [Ancylobacter amanitiformis]|uniref:Crossover junction endodeoxyribonuclease RuvC n=1 Tax=Ancylobacter amanitiformis TaxID=217069 RepID=A0ABU0LNN9_9HYPH|nr:crossover junction endodeoxyribonuclease RuvC [Ancylobacter amanitiformis]MDQ0510321.1 crossover junction endodeoxyribonuclease RuvC [Ancylobacter amanitiformis]
MAASAIRILGLDPGLRRTGWGVIDTLGTRLTFVACGTVMPPEDAALAVRLAFLHAELAKVLRAHAPDEAAVEETFVNMNPASTLKLGQARGVVMLTPAMVGVPVSEYAALLVKKTVVGAGRAEKGQIRLMMKVLLPQADFETDDAADALAVAVTHAQHRGMAALKARVAAR